MKKRTNFGARAKKSHKRRALNRSFSLFRFGFSFTIMKIPICYALVNNNYHSSSFPPFLPHLWRDFCILLSRTCEAMTKPKSCKTEKQYVWCVKSKKKLSCLNLNAQASIYTCKAYTQLVWNCFITQQSRGFFSDWFSRRASLRVFHSLKWD